MVRSTPFLRTVFAWTACFSSVAGLQHVASAAKRSERVVGPVGSDQVIAPMAGSRFSIDAPTTTQTIPRSGLTASVTGRVTDTSNYPIPSVIVVLDSAGRGAVTNDSGYFNIKDVPYGVHSIKLSAVGYKSTVVDSIVVSADR